MLNTRYEEYTQLNNKLPLVLRTGLMRTCEIRSAEANWHENLEIQFIEQGEGYVILDGVKTHVKKGDTVIVNSHVIHYTSTESRIIYSCLIIDLQFCKASDIDPSCITFDSYVKSREIERLFERLKALYTDTKSVSRVAQLRREVLSLLIEIRQKHTLEEKTSLRSGKTESVRRTIKYIKENYREKLTLDVISRNIFCDKYTLCRDFKKMTGKTVVEYINSYRCKKAFELITEGKSVFESAEECGFNNMSFFTKMFKRYIGTLPSQCKKDRI